MDDGGADTPPTARWLAWAAACLLFAALVSAGVVGFGDGSSGRAVVSAAGGTASTVAAPSTVTLPPPPSTSKPAAPTSTIRTTTTLPRAAVEVLRAIGTTAPPTTQPPAPTTTRAPVTSTTPTTVLPSTTTTSTTLAPRATVTLMNRHPNPFVVTVNGQEFDLDSGETEGPAQITLPATGDDVIRVRARSDATCTAESSADHFQPGSSYRVTVVAGTGPACSSFPAPMIEVAPAP